MNVSLRIAQKGNVLFLILIAVALFAALSYAVTKSSSGGGNSISDEDAKLAASVIVQHATNFRAGLQRFLLMNPYDYDNANFDVKDANTLIAAYDPVGCTQDKCSLLHPDGGGVTLPLLPLDYSLPSFTQWYGVFETLGGVGWRLTKDKVQNVGTDKPELILTILGLKYKICEEINEKMNALSAQGTHKAWSASDSAFSGDTPINTNGKMIWCHNKGNDNGIYGSYFYMVVLAR